jgi:hypothetical protein
MLEVLFIALCFAPIAVWGFRKLKQPAAPEVLTLMKSGGVYYVPGDRPPHAARHAFVARIVAVGVLLALILIGVMNHALAGDRPMPIPQQGSAGCAPGYALSPTSRMCAPTPGTRSRAFPAPDSTACPGGWSFSPTSRTCVEIGRR